MSNYLTHLKQVSGVNGDLANAANIVGDSGGSTLSKYLDKFSADAPRDVGNNVGMLVGAAGGAVFGTTKGHPLLGAIMGASIGRNAPALLDSSDRKLALVNIGETTFASVCSLASKGHPAAGFVIGRLIAGAVVYYGKLRD